MSVATSKVHHQRGNVAVATQVLLSAVKKFPTHVSSEDINMLLELQLAQKMFQAALMVLHSYCGVKLLPLPEDCKELTGELLTDSLATFESNDISPLRELLRAAIKEELQKMQVTASPVGQLSVVEMGRAELRQAVHALQQCEVPAEMPVDLRTKLILCLVYLGGGEQLTGGLLDQLQRDEDPEDAGDLFLDVAEALMEVRRVQEARPLLHALVNTRNYGMAAVWLRYGECLQQLGCLREATSAYERTCELAPSHSQARLALCQLLLAQGLTERAIACLESADAPEQGAMGDADQQQDAACVLLRRAQLLQQSGRHGDFIETAKLLHEAHCPPIQTPNEYTGPRCKQASPCTATRGRLSAPGHVVKKRLIAASGLPHLPRDHHRVIVTPRNGLDMRTFSQIKFAKALAVAAALSEEEVTEDVVCSNMMQNIAVISTPAERNAKTYSKITAITLGTAGFDVSAYRAAPDDTCKGIIRGVDADIGQEQLYSLFVHSRNSTALQVKRIKNPTTVIIFFDGLNVANYVICGNSLVRCTLYRRQTDVCYACAKLGHRADVCSHSKEVVCRGCGM
ncbi:hypothetical protein HPB51_002239 [Rhipicephalus microplus]|uniref:Uncharacterized protein n=1 Tax=Rhipicephalus microplus TaxID=6941 RepID=A0A9J6EX48_RHIMP|nr:hypothetical protein HPB51_002239 [Rhipicephalus microplus]